MRLLQLNLWTGRLLTHAIDLIKELNPEILCLQEVTSGADGMILPQNKMFSNLEAILEATPYAYHYFSPTFYFTYQDKLVNHGNAILSRYPVMESVTHFISGTEAVSLNPSEREPNIRNLQIVKLNLTDKQLTVANHHGYWHESPLGDEVSIDCMKRVAEYLRPYGSPLIMTGDLNLRSQSPPMETFNNFLLDLNTKYSVSDTLSPIRGLGPIDCDHVLVSPDVQVQEYKVRDELVSDHKAILLDFEL